MVGVINHDSPSLKIGLIGGTGFSAAAASPLDEIKVATPFAPKPVTLKIAELNNTKFVFLARGGDFHTVTPDKVPHRANIWALKLAGVKRLIALDAVASLSPSVECPAVGIVEQYIDLTNRTNTSFFEDDATAHIALVNPTCPDIATHFKGMRGGLTCVVTGGSRFNTRAEGHYQNKIGGDIVSHHGMPEATLAREAGICYANLVAIADHDAGVTTAPTSTKTTLTNLRNLTNNLQQELAKALPKLTPDCQATCQTKLTNAIATPSTHWTPKTRHIATRLGVTKASGWQR